MIVITRPLDSAQFLLSELEKNHLPSLLLPLIELVPRKLCDVLENQLAQFGNDSESRDDFYHIFSSVNAVKFATPYLSKYFPKLKELTNHHFYAIGPNTAKALFYLGYSDVDTAPPPYHSESLLTMKNLQESQTNRSMKHAFLWSILNGRRLLSYSLKQRKFNVWELPVYQQINRAISVTEKEKVDTFRRKQSLIITATSQTIIDQIQAHGLYQPGDCVLCLSKRITDYAKEQGMTHLFTAKQANMSSLINTIIEMKIQRSV